MNPGRNDLFKGQMLSNENFSDRAAMNYMDMLSYGSQHLLKDRKVLTIRRMQLGDLKRVHQLEKQIFRDAWSLDSFRIAVENWDRSLPLVAVLQGLIIGYSVSTFVADEVHIANIAVEKSHRRRKVGEYLLDVTLNIARGRGMRTAHLEVRKSNAAAIALYQKFGFKIVGLREGYYAREKEDALLMTKTYLGDGFENL